MTTTMMIIFMEAKREDMNLIAKTEEKAREDTEARREVMNTTTMTT